MFQTRSGQIHVSDTGVGACGQLLKVHEQIGIVIVDGVEAAHDGLIAVSGRRASWAFVVSRCRIEVLHVPSVQELVRECEDSTVVAVLGLQQRRSVADALDRLQLQLWVPEGLS